ncbi:MAG: RsmD family RNA methyltransferase [Methanoregula sp.]|nr:RsmD family RNA methyltransferase [Methanoregula sp.]
MRGIIPDRTLCHLSDHFDVIGDIAVLSLSPYLVGHEGTIARAIISKRRTIKTVLNKISPLNGCKRTACYEILAGKETVTVHHEYGSAYELDVGAVFFNPRLASERKRVTDQVQSGECVLLPFCGVGPFVIPAAARRARIIAVEKNPEAYRWLTRNIQVNGVEDRVTTLPGDAFDMSRIPVSLFDRAIIPTPYGMDTIFDVLASRVKPEGMIHFYTFKNQDQADALVREFSKKGFEVVVRQRCGNVAPSVSRWVFDLVKKNA